MNDYLTAFYQGAHHMPLHRGLQHPSYTTDLGTNRKGVYDFLLVINSNFGPTLERFWDTSVIQYEIILLGDRGTSVEYIGEISVRPFL